MEYIAVQIALAACAGPRGVEPVSADNASEVHHIFHDQNNRPLKEAAQHKATTTQPQKPFFNNSGPDHFFGGGQRSATGDNFFQKTGAQPKLEVGGKDDAFERQADQTADSVVARLGQSASAGHDGALLAGPAPKGIQRRFESDEQPGVSQSIQRKEASTHAPAVAPSSVESGVQSSKGKGVPMAAQTSANMESAFGQDFSNVRIHDNNEAAAMNSAVGAKAFAHGNDIYFNAGQYDPQSKAGAHLLAHELTHTLQQQGGQVKRSIQRAGGTRKPMNKQTDATLKDHGDKLGGKYRGFVKRKGPSIEVHMEMFESKKYLADADTSWLQADMPVKLNKSKKKRDTRQIAIWKQHVKKEVADILKGLSKNENAGSADLSLNLKRKGVMIGKLNQIADEVSVPFWSCEGNQKNFDVEHMIDYQICGKNADDIRNLILLDRAKNRSLGTLVKDNLIRHFSAISEHYREEFSGFGSDPEATMARFDIYLDSFDIKNGFLADEDWYYPAEMKDKHAKGNPYKEKFIQVVDAKIPDGKFMLRASDTRPGYLLPLKCQDLRMGAWKITADYDKQNDKLKTLLFSIAVEDKDRTIQAKGGKLKPFAVDFSESGTRSYSISDVNLRKKFGPVFKELYGEVKGMSPIELNEPDVDGLDASVSGRVVSTLSIFKHTHISFSMFNGEYTIQAQVTGADLQGAFPKPFRVSGCSLVIAASSVSGLSVLGNIAFDIGQFGSGEVEAGADKNGVTFAGKFNFNSQWFKPGEIKVGYKQGKWSMGGKIGIPEGMVPGVRNAALTVGYEDEVFSAAGEAALSIPGVDKVMLAASFEQGGFSFTAEAALSGLPGIKNGSIRVTIGSKGEDGIKLSAEGHASPDFPGVPGLEGDLAVHYDDGLFDMRTKINYKRGRFEGEVALGVTNMAVDEQGQPIGGPDPAGGLSVFGYGQLTVTLFGENKATVNVRFTPDRQLMVAGEASLNDLSPFGDGYSFEKEILPFPRLTIPLIGIPGMSVSAFIDGGVFFKFNWQPLLLKQLKVAFNETNINDLSSAKVEITGSIGSIADVELYMAINAGIKAQVLIASLTGSLGGEAGLGISAEAGGDVKAEFDMENGLRFKEINAHLNVAPRAIFRLTGSVSVDLDLWITTVNLYYHKWILAEGGLDLAGLSLSVDFPIRFDDDNRVIPPEYNTMSLTKPDFTGSAGKDILDKAINGDAEKELAEKKEEIRRSIRYDLRNATTDEDFTPSKYQKEMVKKYGKSPELKAFVIDSIREESLKLEYEQFNFFKTKIRAANMHLNGKLAMVNVSAVYLYPNVSDSDMNAFRRELVKADEARKAAANGAAPMQATPPSHNS